MVSASENHMDLLDQKVLTSVQCGSPHCHLPGCYGNLMRSIYCRHGWAGEGALKQAGPGTKSFKADE